MPKSTNAPAPAPLAYTIEDLAAVTGIGRSKLYAEVRAGNLRVTKVGSRTIILTEDAHAWLRARRDRKPAAGGTS